VSRRRFLQATWLGASGVALSSCGWRLADVQSTGPQSGDRTDQIYIYTWSSYIDQPLLDGFQVQTGLIPIAQVYDSNEAMLATFQAGKARIYSVIYPSDYAVAQMVEKQYLSVLDETRLEGLGSLLPNFATNGLFDQKRYSVPLSWGTTGLIYNSEKLPDPPTDWDYLWQHQEKLTRRMTLLNDVREVFGAVLHSLGYSQNTDQPQQIQQAYEKLAALKPAVASFTTDAWRDPLIAGDLWVAMGYSVDATDVMQQNPKLRYVIPQSGTNLWVDTMVIPITAPNPEGAYAWLNYLYQPQVSAQLTQRMGFAPVTQTAIDQLPAAVRQDPVKFPSAEVLGRCETMTPLPSAVSALYDQYWIKLTS
jgi:spermidine/putrescine transport system substrate-binding protein